MRGINNKDYLERVEIEMNVTNYASDTRRFLTSYLVLPGSLADLQMFFQLSKKH